MDLDLDLNKVNEEQNELHIKPIHQNVDHSIEELEKATFGMGCYWAAESLFGGTKGVLKTRVGYSGGKLQFTENDIGDHTEVVEICFDPKVISYMELLDLFWNNHEITVTNKRKYMSLIICHNQEQKVIAAKSVAVAHLKHNAGGGQLIEIQEASIFHPANDGQQKYKLQQHKNLAISLGLNPELLQTSYVATKLNGFVVGIGGLDQFTIEAQNLGLTPTQLEYVKYYMEKSEGYGLSC